MGQLIATLFAVLTLLAQLKRLHAYSTWGVYLFTIVAFGGIYFSLALFSLSICTQVHSDEYCHDKKNFMELMNIEKTGLNYLIEKGYKLLELETFFTSGPEESRAWTVKKDSTAPVAAGKIHSDFEKGFIRAETISFDDFVNNNGWLNCKNNGKMRLEGKDYIVKDGDILNFRFNT